MSNKIFVGRVKTEEKNGVNGPWTKTSISFNKDDLAKLQEHMNEAGYVNLDFNRSKKGNEYIEINTYKAQSNAIDLERQMGAPQQQAEYNQQLTPQPAVNGFSQNISEMNNQGGDIPF